MNPFCPTCHSPSEKLGTMNVSVSGNAAILMEVYQCASKSCLIHIPYPEGATWRTEFVLLDGKPHIIRPTAAEFA